MKEEFKSKLSPLVQKIKARVAKNKLAFFIGGSLAIASVAVFASLGLYYISGTAQLDLSRPSYQEAREQARKQAEEEKRREKKSEDWIMDGHLTAEKIDEFEKVFTERMGRVEGVNFDSETLSDRTFNLETNDKKENR